MIRGRRPAISGWEGIGDYAESGDGDETFREEPDRVAEPAALPDEEPCAAEHEDGGDGEDCLLVPSKARSSRNHFGRDDIRVLIVHGLERREVEVGIRVASGDVEAWRVVIALGYDGAVGSSLPFQDAAVIQEIDGEWHYVVKILALTISRGVSLPNFRNRREAPSKVRIRTLCTFSHLSGIHNSINQQTPNPPSQLLVNLWGYSTTPAIE